MFLPALNEYTEFDEDPGVVGADLENIISPVSDDPDLALQRRQLARQHSQTGSYSEKVTVHVRTVHVLYLIFYNLHYFRRWHPC